VTLATDLYSPRISSTKTVQDLTRPGTSDLQPGDVLRYTMVVANTGQDGAKNVTLTDPIPANSTYVPGSLRIVSGAAAGAKTDQAGDDQAQFNSAAGNVVFRLGTGANATTGGVLAIGDTTTIQFDVQVSANAPNRALINNQATITAVGQTSGF